MDKTQLLEKVKTGTSFKDRTGEKHLTKEGYEVIIIKYFHARSCIICFNDKNKTVLNNVQYSHVKEGSVRNPFHPSVCGIGYLGEGTFKKHINGKANKLYKTWSGMIRRCYDKNTQENQPAYIGCFVSEEWHNFQVFAQWFEENYIEGFHLDKDILFKGNKIYSPKTCCFVPDEINTLFVKNNKKRGSLPIGVSFHNRIKKYSACINKKCDKVHIGYFNYIEEAFEAYKKVKEKYIKDVSDKWRGKITEQVYNAMYNYQVEITD